MRKLLNWLLQYLFIVCIGSVLIAYDPFEIGGKSEKAWQDVLYRLLAPLYNSPARDDIVVVLVTEEATKNLYDDGYLRANEWPLTYRDQARLLEDILFWKPRAIFVDINFRIERSTDDSWPDMERRLTKARAEHPTPILFARDNASEPLTPFQTKLDTVVDFTINGWRNIDGYPLSVENSTLAAVDLYRLACPPQNPLPGCRHPWNTDITQQAEPISVVWGSRVPTLAAPSLTLDLRCSPEKNTLSILLLQETKALFLGLLGMDTSDLLQRCPYHAVLYADQLVAIKRYGTTEQQAALAARLQDHIILYATDLIGLHDVVQTPIHGELPGVMYHAMALDNLMTLGQGYMHAVDGDTYNLMTWLILAWVYVFCARQRMEADDTFFVCASLLVLLSLVQVLVLRLEPANAIGLLGFLAGIQLLNGLDPGNIRARLRLLREQLVRLIMRISRRTPTP